MSEGIGGNMGNDMGGSLIELDPEIRRAEGIAGIPVVLGDGKTWLLADGGLGNALDQIRDRIFDDSVLDDEVDFEDLAEVAFALLSINYDLTAEEAAPLLLGADRREIVRAVGDALYGPTDVPRTYTSWAVSSMLANGIDPDSVPLRYRQFVLDNLVWTRRAIPMAKFIESTQAAATFGVSRAGMEKRRNPGDVEGADPSPEAGS